MPLAPLKRGIAGTIIWTPAHVAEVLRLRDEDNLSAAEIAARYATSRAAILSVWKRYREPVAVVRRERPSAPSAVLSSTLPVTEARARAVAALVAATPALTRAGLMRALGLDASKLSAALSFARRLRLLPDGWEPLPPLPSAPARLLACGSHPGAEAARWLAATTARAVTLGRDSRGLAFAEALARAAPGALSPYTDEIAALLLEAAARPGALKGTFWSDDPQARRDRHGRELPRRDLGFSPTGSIAAACLGGC